MQYGSINLGTPLTINAACHAISLKMDADSLQDALKYNAKLVLFDVKGNENEIFDRSLSVLHSLANVGDEFAYRYLPSGKVIVTIPFSFSDFALTGREELKLTISKNTTSAPVVSMDLQLEQMPQRSRVALFNYVASNVPATAINHIESVDTASSIFIEDASLLKSVTYRFNNGEIVKYSPVELQQISFELKPKTVAELSEPTTATLGSSLTLPLTNVMQLEIESEDVSGQKMYKLLKPSI